MHEVIARSQQEWAKYVVDNPSLYPKDVVDLAYQYIADLAACKSSIGIESPEAIKAYASGNKFMQALPRM